MEAASMSDELTFAEAEAMLPEGDSIHTFRSGAGLLLGADWPRGAILAALREAKTIGRSGAVACSLKHGIVIQESGKPLFIETVVAADQRREKRDHEA
jgi:hypothetical protein